MKSDSPKNRLTETLARLTAFIACAALLTGCVVTSVYPHYAEKDISFDPELVGVWIDAKDTNKSGGAWTFEKADERSYKLVVKEEKETTEFDAHLFRLKGQLFLDLLPRASGKECADGFIPTHFLLRVASIKPEFQWDLMNPKWLSELLEKNPNALRHLKDAPEKSAGVLTADTAELQKFLIKHLKNKEAWTDEPTRMKRQ